MKQLLAILGDNVSYSLSPYLHNASAKYLRRDAVYVPLSVSNAQSIPLLIQALAAVDNCLGFNVTQPFKQTVAAHFSLASVNTVYRQDGKFAATSTDGEGFWQGLQQLKPDAISKVIILGNGGAALALLEFWQAKFPHCPVQVLRRNSRRDQLFKGAEMLDLTPATLASVLAGGNELLVQATSAARKGDKLERYVPALTGFNGIYVELDYDQHSLLYNHVKAKGVRCQDGLPMLIEQARLAQKLWWGEAAPSEYLHELMQERDKQ